VAAFAALSAEPMVGTDLLPPKPKTRGPQKDTPSQSFRQVVDTSANRMNFTSG
jgi:hypothetical protein